MDTKKIYQSLTIWFNGFLLFLPDIMIFLQSMLDEKIIEDPRIVYWLVKIIASVNIYLRIVKTKTALN